VCGNGPTTKMQDVQHYIIVIRCSNTNLVTLYEVFHSEQSYGLVVAGGVVSSGSCASAVYRTTNSQMRMKAVPINIANPSRPNTWGSGCQSSAEHRYFFLVAA
jgi:hypothetical protein